VQAILVARKAKPALVQANDWNTMWSGLAMKLAYRTQLVYDSHELWPDRNGRWEWRPWLLASEALFVRIADEVLTSSPGYAEVLSRRYRISRPTIVRNIPERRSAQRDGRPSEPLVVYIGGIMPGRGLEQMIDALPLMPEVRLRAVGPGAASYQADLLERAACAGAQEQIELRPAVSPSEVAAALEHASAGLCLIQPICRSYELCLPNKLFEYAAAGVPVLASDMPVLAAIVRGGGIGEVTATSRPEAIAMSLRRLLEPNCWQLAVRRAQEFADVHGWEVEARTLQAAYTSALNGAGP
jgi:glycosyltransferase involved in cell wall biosynthesis